MVQIRLKELLSDRHMTQAELARLTKIRPSTICDIYNGTCIFLKIEHIEVICKWLNCNVGELVTYI